MLNFNDVWGWACADGEVVPPDEIKTVARLFRAWAGRACSTGQPQSGRPALRIQGQQPVHRLVAREEALIAAVPDSNKRAYMDLPPVLVDLRKAPDDVVLPVGRRYLGGSTHGCRWAALPSGDAVRVEYFYQWRRGLVRWQG